jgi:hypothetical protein
MSFILDPFIFEQLENFYERILTMPYTVGNLVINDSIRTNIITMPYTHNNVAYDMSNETYRNGFMVFISVTWFVTIPIGIISVLVSESINDNYEARNKCDKCGKDGLRIDKKV